MSLAALRLRVGGIGVWGSVDVETITTDPVLMAHVKDCQALCSRFVVIIDALIQDVRVRGDNHGALRDACTVRVCAVTLLREHALDY